MLISGLKNRIPIEVVSPAFIEGVTTWLEGSDFVSGQAWNDKSGYNNSATPYNGVGSGANFDGVDDYFIINNGAIKAGNQASLCIKTYFNNTVSTGCNVFRATQSVSSRVLNFHMASDGTVYFQCGGTSDADIDSITIPVEVSSFVQKWVFWAFTKNCDTGEMKIYKDGVCILTGTGMVKTINTPATIYIGSYTPTMNFYSGGIGHISLYNRELSLAEINRIYDYVMGV